MSILVLLVWLIVLIAAFAIVWWLITRLNIPEPIRTVVIAVLAILALVALVWLVMGVIGAPPPPRALP